MFESKIPQGTPRYYVYINAENCGRIQLTLICVHHRSITQFKEGKHVRYNIGKKCKNYPAKVSGDVVLFIFCVTIAHLIYCA